MKNEDWYWNEKFNTDQIIATNESACRQEHEFRPSTLYKPKLSLDGNRWSALLGPNLMEGFCAFGNTPAEAFKNFDRDWENRKPAGNES